MKTILAAIVRLAVTASIFLLLVSCHDHQNANSGNADGQQPGPQPVNTVNEKLIKGTDEYYGFQDSISTFLTCDGTHIQIADGHVVSSNRPCGPVTPNRPLPLLRKLNGPVVNVDPEKGIVEIKPPGSQNPVKFFVPQTAGAQKQMLKGIKPGDKLQVTTLLPGRAEKFEKSS